MNPLAPYSARMTWLTAVFVTAFCALVASVGADAHWLAALGGDIVRLGHIPDGVPYAAASTSGWENVPVLGELVFHGLEAALGDRGLLFAQGIAVAVACGLVALDMREGGAADAPSALVLLLVAVGSASALLVIRAQLFSLALFPALVLVLRRQSRAPTDTVWLLVPLLALWANLYGGVLVGLAVAVVYLLVERLRRERLVALAVVGLFVAACLATPALLGSLRYYRGVVLGEAASSGEGLWAPLSPSRPLDLAFCLAALVVVGLAVAARPKLWELVVLACLTAATIHVGRNGVWLLLFAAAPAARALSGSRAWAVRIPGALMATLGLGLLVLLAGGLSRTPPPASAGRELRAAAARAAAGSPLLADDINAEAVALDGHTVLIANPLDAFPAQEQRLYLDWIAGRPDGDRLLAQAQAVLVTRGAPAAQRLARNPSFRLAGRDRMAALFVRYRPARWQSPPSTGSTFRAS